MDKISKNKLASIIKNNAWLTQKFNALPLYLLNSGGISLKGQYDALTKQFTGANYRHFVIIGHNKRATFLYDERDLARIGVGFYKKIKNAKQLNAWIWTYDKNYHRTKKITGHINDKQLNEYSLKKLADITKRISEEYASSVSFSHTIEGISFTSETRLKEILDKRSLNRPETFQLLSCPLQPSFLAIAQNILWRINRTRGQTQSSLIRLFLKKFAWIDSNYVVGKTLTEPEVLAKAKQRKARPRFSDYRQIRLEKNKLIKILNLTPQELFVIKTIEMVSKWQDDRKKYILQTVSRFEQILDEISKRIDVPAEKLKFLCPQEISYKNFVDKNFLAKLALRFPRTAYYLQRNKTIILAKKESKQIEKLLAQGNNEKAAELKGMVANKGLATGRVKKINNIRDISKIKKGEILVASMTRPEFLPAMQKAAAIITDEGGITSHAAIISRELNIPCIIGTRIATRIFNNGEMVEVNADEGWIKKQ